MLKSRGMRILSAGVAAVLVMGTACPVFAASGIEKEETVYAVADSQLNIDEVIVSEWLKNNDEQKTITDKSDLTDIENVKGDETFKQDGKTVKWNADGNDIYYQGKSDKELPVKMSASYMLDGKYVTPEEIKGQKGSVEIHITYQAQQSSPFAAVTGMVLDGDKFSNVKINSGQIINSGDDYYVAGIALPGMADITGSLGLDISDEIVIKADTTDFTYETMVTVLSNEMLKDLDGDLGSLGDLQSSVDELVSSSQMLTDGAKTLSDGISTAAEKFGLVDGYMTKLQDGVTEIDKNMKTLKAGLAKLSKGSTDLYAGVSDLQTSLEATYKGANDLVAGMNMLSPDDIEKATSGVGQIYTGLKNVDAGLDKLYTTMSGINSKESEVIGQLKQIREAYKAAGVDTAALDKAIAGLEQTNAGQGQAIENLSSSGEIRTGVDQLAQGAKGASGQLAEGVKSLKEGSVKLQQALEAEAAGAKTLAGYTKDLNDGIASAYNGADKLAAGTSTLNTSTGKIAAGTAKLGDGVTELKDGALELSTGMKKFNDEGLGSIAAMYDKIANSSVDSMNSKIDAAKAYRNYAGAAKDADTTVKFIIRSEGI